MQYAIRNLMVLLGFAAAAAIIYAQGLGSISGTVTDPSGAVIPSAVVTATQTATGAVTVVKTNQDGAYVFPSLLPGDYSITISAPNFKNFRENSITLQANQSMAINAVLAIGQTSQTVSVSANAVQVNTVTGTLSEVIGNTPVNDLPLNGRNVAQLTTLVAGVIETPNDGTDAGVTKSFPVVVPISANGARAGQTTYLLDGADNVDTYTEANLPFPFPDALQEFSFQTSNYSAEFGQNAGGVVNVVTKSGGKQFHGDLFEFVRSGALNARNYFASSVDPLKRNQFGGTLGGPAIIPHLSSGKNTFFFFGFQRTLSRDKVGGKTAFVPTQANLNGDFSALLDPSSPDNPVGKAIQLYNPFTGAKYDGDKIPVGDFDPAALAVTKDLPSVTGDGQIVYASPTDQNFWQILARGDHTFNQHDRAYAHYYDDTFTQAGVLDTSNLVKYADQSNIHFQSAVINETHIFDANLLNNLVVGYEREISIRGPLSGAPDPASFGVKIWQPTQPSIQDINVSGFFSIGANPQATFQRNNYTLTDNVHWVRGRHNVAFGVNVELAKNDVNSLNEETGKFYFNSTGSNYALASFLLGYMDKFQQGSGQVSNDRDQFVGLYGQDSWQFSQNLTLNYGLRWEPFIPWHEIGHRLMQFNPAAFASGRTSTVYTNAPAGLLFPGDKGVPEQGVRNSYSSFMPRVGFAWNPFGNGKTAIRGGGGVFFQTRQDANSNQKSSQTTPYSLNVDYSYPNGPFSNPYLGINNPFPAPSRIPSDIAFPSPVLVYTYNPSETFHVPVTYAWNLTVEQQLTSNLLLRASYVGSHSGHLFVAPDLNPATYIPGSKLSADQRRHLLGYSDITETAMVGNDTYNAFQATLQQRVTNGLSFMANYTLSGSSSDMPLSDEITDQDTGQSYVYPIYRPNYKALDIGPPDFQRTSVFSGSYVWHLPKLTAGNLIARGVLDGWQTAGIFQIESGQPITVTAGKDVSQTNLGNDRGQYNGGSVYGAGACSVGSNCKNYLNPTVFALPATGQFGNVKKGAFRGPGYFDWDGSLIRNIRLRERAHLQFRAEYFNLINHTNFDNPVTSVSSGDFGGITSASDPRIAQLSLKLMF